MQKEKLFLITFYQNKFNLLDDVSDYQFCMDIYIRVITDLAVSLEIFARRPLFYELFPYKKDDLIIYANFFFISLISASVNSRHFPTGNSPK